MTVEVEILGTTALLSGGVWSSSSKELENVLNTTYSLEAYPNTPATLSAQVDAVVRNLGATVLSPESDEDTGRVY